MSWKVKTARSLYRTTSGVQVLDNYFFRTLTLSHDCSALQTVMNNFFPAKPALSYMKALMLMAKIDPGNCCLLGLGGAGIAHALAPFMPKYTIVGVEISAEIIELAAAYFKSAEIANLTVIHAEANAFILNYKAHFKHILVDIFDTEAFPENCHHINFFTNCKRLLLKDGVLAVNLANKNEHASVYQMMKQLFPKSLLTIPVQKCNNLVLIGANGDNRDFILQQLSREQALKTLLWDNYWGCVGVLA